MKQEPASSPTTTTTRYQWKFADPPKRVEKTGQGARAYAIQRVEVTHESRGFSETLKLEAYKQ